MSRPSATSVAGIHFWVANIVMATVLLHMGRVFVTGSYKRPREANWLIGLGLLGVTLGLIFTGTVLKWDQEGYEALGHNVEIGDSPRRLRVLVLRGLHDEPADHRPAVHGPHRHPARRSASSC